MPKKLRPTVDFMAFKCRTLRVKLYRYNPKHLCPKLNGFRDNGKWSLKLWQLLHTYWLPNWYWNWQEYVVSVMFVMAGPQQWGGPKMFHYGDFRIWKLWVSGRNQIRTVGMWFHILSSELEKLGDSISPSFVTAVEDSLPGESHARDSVE